MVCQFLLYNKVNQLYTYIYPHISPILRLPPPLPIPPLQVDTKHRADLPMLCSCFLLAIYFTFGSVCMSFSIGFEIDPCYVSSLFFFCIAVYSILFWKYTTIYLSILSLIDVQVCFQFWTLKNSAAINILVHVSGAHIHAFC